MSVQLALGNNSGSGTLSGTLTEPTNASGVATFSDLSINNPGFGYTLTASSTGLTGATSNPFSESNTETTDCSTVPSGDQCTTDLRTSVSDLQISADPAAGTLTESVDVGSPLSCANEANGGYTGFDPNTYEFSETGTVDKTLSYELFGLNSDQESQVFMCFGATYPFAVSRGRPVGIGDAARRHCTGFVGLLPTCDSTDGTPRASSRSSPTR